MTVDDKVGQFLKQNRGRGFCDGCIAYTLKDLMVKVLIGSRQETPHAPYGAVAILD
jgi:hypothetical protein